jgi:hypothetical protein
MVVVLALSLDEEADTPIAARALEMASMKPELSAGLSGGAVPTPPVPALLVLPPMRP